MEGPILTLASAMSSGKFASGVVLGDLNDFIEPSQACVNPLFAADVNQKDERSGAAKVAVDSSVFAGIPCVCAAWLPGSRRS